MAKKKVTPKVPVKSVEKARKGRLSRRGALSPAVVVKLQRRYRVIDMRASGATYEEIAKTLGVSTAVVSEDLRVLMEDTVSVTKETTELARAVADRRLDMMISAHMPYATEEKDVPVRNSVTGAITTVKAPPSTAHAQIVLQVDQRKSKLLGLDKPEEKHLKVSGIREYIGVDWDDV